MVIRGRAEQPPGPFANGKSLDGQSLVTALAMILEPRATQITRTRPDWPNR